jgi:ATP adenylyltransferase
LRGSEIWSIYRELLRGCRKALGIQEDDDRTACSHNMVLTKDWILVIPRRTRKYGGLMVNAMGVMGIPAVANEELFGNFKRIRPGKVLSEMGIPRKVPD